ncbi:helix-turn-helix domain-containing protein [Evtepia sp.]|jgi:DNA-binding transcriptional MerR regulator|uniref:helix-turn-helix domain-containing protein n=1 Tax=Evtepia sp. TaxID=2773933 RepID=UPI002E770388|nr:helix-turn-helix domain-containing protein [Evtepia sp.]MEE0749084.1 helix-turn-helix domain-containing protein [Evtepia sp.]
MSRQRKLEVIQQAEDVTIGELVRLTDVRYSTLKYYTEEGMLPFQQAEENLTRRYKREASIRRIRRIKALRAEGKSIPQIKALLQAEDAAQPQDAPQA